jgi:hypothetical protein
MSALVAKAELKGDDFNQMIQENQKNEQQLRQKLQKDAGITFNEKVGHIDQSKIQAPTEAEQVIVSSNPVWKANKKDRSARTLQKAEMKRLSQELEEAR